jgi:membrane-associated PAP2 superfamily phosphatase
MNTRYVRLLTVLALSGGAADSPWTMSVYGGDSVAALGFDSAHDAQGRGAFPVALAATHHFE